MAFSGLLSAPLASVAVPCASLFHGGKAVAFRDFSGLSRIRKDLLPVTKPKLPQFSSSQRRGNKLHGVTLTAVASLDPVNLVVPATTSPAADMVSSLGSAGITTQLAGLGVAVGVGLIALFFAKNNGNNEPEKSKEAPAQVEAPRLVPENGVLVFGAGGKTGREVVAQLVKSGRSVVCAARDASRCEAALASVGVTPGKQEGQENVLIVRGGVNIVNPSTMPADLFEGITQVVSCVGPVFGKLPEGGMGILDGMTNEAVDANGVKNILAAAQAGMRVNGSAPDAAAARADAASFESVTFLPMASPTDVARWQPLDDVIMGGSSSSAMSWIAPEGTEGVEGNKGPGGALWSGTLITQGGGFCGTRTTELGADLSSFDGLRFRVRGDGQRYKLNLKTAQLGAEPEVAYQAAFDTVAGEWTEVMLPWSAFVAVRMATTLPNAPPLTSSAAKRVLRLGLVLSRFEFNRLPNPSYKPGRFNLEIAAEGFSAYKSPRPQVVLMSTAGVERNALITEEEQRKADIPIVQLNPGGALNWKYFGEQAVRSSGLRYTIIRPTGLTTEEGEGAPVELWQGDYIAGKISRAEVAEVIASVLTSPAAADKTIEVRRAAGVVKGRGGSGLTVEGQLLRCVQDRDRVKAGMRPFPAWVEPPPPVTEDRLKEILADPRVQAARIRDEQREKAEAATRAPAGSPVS